MPEASVSVASIAAVAAVAAASTLQASAASNLEQEDDYFNNNNNNNNQQQQQQQQQQSINASIGQDGSSVVALLAARLPSHPQLVTQLTLLVIINLIVVAGNILVILAVCASAKLKCVTNTFVVSLAIADLLLGFLVLPYAVLFEVLDAWVFGELWCRGWLAMDVWISTASILNLCAISIDRYVAVTRPVKYRALMTARRAKSIVAGVWLVAFVICLPPLIPQWAFSGSSSSLGAAALGNSTLGQANASSTSMPLNENSTPTLARYTKTSSSTFDNNNDDGSMLAIQTGNKTKTNSTTPLMTKTNAGDKDVLAVAGGLAASTAPAHGNSNRRSSRRRRRMRQNVAWYLCCCDIGHNGDIGGGGGSPGAKTPPHANCALQAPHVPSLPAAEFSILASNTTRDKANVVAAAMKCDRRQLGSRLAPPLSVRSIAATTPESNHHNCRFLASKFKSNVLADAGSVEEAVVVDQRSRCIAQRCARGHLDKRISSGFEALQLERQDQVGLSGRQSHDHRLDLREQHHHHQRHHQQHQLQRWSLTKSEAIVARSLAANEIGNNDHRNRRAAVKPPALEVASVTAGGGFNSLEASGGSKAAPATPTVAPTATTTTSAITTNKQRQRGCALFDGKLYVVYSALGSFYIPMLVMVFVYSRIYLVAARAQRALKRGYVTAKAPQQRKRRHSTHGRHSKAAKAAGAKNGGASTSANANDANASPFDAGGERVTLRIHRRERNAVNSTSATGTTAGTCSGEQQASYGQLSALERLGAAEQRRQAATVATEAAMVAGASNPPKVIQVQAQPPTSPEPQTQQAPEPQTHQSKALEPVVVTHPSRRQCRRKRASCKRRAARQAPHAAGSAIAAAVSVAAGSLSSVRITLSPCADFDYDHGGNHKAYEICHQTPLPLLPVAIEVTPPTGTESDVTLLAASVKERSRSVHVEPNDQLLEVDLLNGQQRFDRSNSCTLNAAAGWQEEQRKGCSADLRAAASDGVLVTCGASTTSEVGGTQNAGCLPTPEVRVRPHRASSSSSIIHGLLGELRAPANQVRKQSILLISTITSRSSQTLRHLSLAASQPVGSLFKHRSRHRRSGSSSASTSASSADESCDDDDEDGGGVRKNTASSRCVRKQRRRRAKRTLDDYLMGVAGIDSTTTESSSSADESVNDGDDVETATTLFVPPPQMSEQSHPQVQVSGPEANCEVAITSNPIAQLKTNAVTENAAAAQTIATQIAETKQTAATKEELNNKQQATTQSAQKTANQLDTTSASRQSLSKRGMRRFNNWHAKRLHERRFAAEYRIAAMIGVIVGGFCLCWLPFFTAYLWRAVVCERPDCVPKSLLSLFIWLGYFNSAVNPVLYGLFSQDFRAAFKNIVFRCRLRSATDNSTVAQLVDNILKSIL